MRLSQNLVAGTGISIEDGLNVVVPLPLSCVWKQMKTPRGTNEDRFSVFCLTECRLDALSRVEDIKKSRRRHVLALV